MHSTGLIAVLLLIYVSYSFACLSNPGQLPCDLNSCLNGATCTNVDVTSYVCSCTDSYEGNNCETLKASPCASSPCQNGGTCSVVADFYFCTCEAAKYAGYNCELTVSPCTSGPCQNGGTCNQIGNTFDYTCDCPAGFFDDTCSSSITSTTVATSTIPTTPKDTTKEPTCIGDGPGFTPTTTPPDTPPFTTTPPDTPPFTDTTTSTVPTTPSDSPKTTLPQCPNNQEYHFCASACPRTCRSPEITICIEVCQQRCACPFELPIFDEDTGFCVTLETCPGSTATPSSVKTTATTTPTTIPTSTITVRDTWCILFAPCGPGFQCVDVNGGSDYLCCREDQPDSCTGGRFTTPTLKTTTATTGSDPSTTVSFITVPPTTTVTPCEPSPCQNGGTCTDNLDATYTCECKEGYNGTDCENDFTCSGNLAECLPIMSDFSRTYVESVAYCEANGWHLAYVEDSAKYELMLNWVQTFWQTEFAGFDIDTRNHWLGMQYLGNRQAANLGGVTTPYTILNWYPLGYPTSLTSFPDNDRMVMLASVSDSNSFFQGLRNIDPFSTYYAVCQNPAYISTL